MFEETLIESSRSSSRSGRGISFPLSVALHVLGIGGAIGASVWYVEDSPEPPVPVIFYSPRLSPPPVGTTARAGSVPRRMERRADPALPTLAVLRTVPERAQGKEGGSPENPDVSGEDAGPGDPGAVPGGTGDDEDGQAGQDRDADIPIPIGGDVRPPQLVSRTEPEYPEVERRGRKEGTVIIEATITADGTVRDVRLLKSADTILDEAAKRAVLQWRYRPATLNGRAVPVYLRVTVSFRLH